jgi:hypothetical protein
MGGRFWDHYGLSNAGEQNSIILLDTKLAYSRIGKARAEQAKISANLPQVTNRWREALAMERETGLPVRAAYVCYVDGEGLDDDLKSRRGWYLVPSHHFKTRLSLREDVNGVKIPLMTGPDESLESLSQPGKAQNLAKRIFEETMKIDPKKVREAMAKGGKKLMHEQLDYINEDPEGPKAMSAKMAESKEGQKAMLSSLTPEQILGALSPEQAERIRRLLQE